MKIRAFFRFGDNEFEAMREPFLGALSIHHSGIYVGIVQVRPLIDKREYISVAERDRQGLFGESPCTQRLRLAYRVAARLPALTASAYRVG